MHVKIPDFLLPPKRADYEDAQKAALLYVMLLAALAGAVFAGIGNLSKGWTTEATSLIVLAMVCLVGLILNSRRHHQLAGFILCSALVVIMGFLLYHGAGLHDETVTAYPIFILCSAFLFRRRGLVIATLLSIASVITIYELELHGVHISKYPDTLYRVLMLSFLFIVLGLVVWIVRDTWLSTLRHLQESYDLTLSGWAKALEYRDMETAGHSQRVTELCLRLARGLGMTDKHELIQMERGGYLHDIGKMAIPDQILLKPGALTDEEREVMKRHPLLAVEFIAGIPYLDGAGDIPHYHHESWDGSGYPEGRKGQEIPLAARIFAVVDHWDALNSDRPYRKAWPREKVIAYMRENAGKLFDPHIVDVFLGIVEDDGPDRR